VMLFCCGAWAEMTNDEFDQVVEAIRQGQITLRERRVIAAATFMMRELCSVPDDFEPMTLPPTFIQRQLESGSPCCPVGR
jgi:hypothetical protein